MFSENPVFLDRAVRIFLSHACMVDGGIGTNWKWKFTYPPMTMLAARRAWG